MNFSMCAVSLLMQVFLAKRKHDGKFYAVKILQKKIILNRKEVKLWSYHHWVYPYFGLDMCMIMLHVYCCANQQKHIMAERNVLLKNVKHPFLVGLHYSFQTKDKLYFVLDFINGGEVSCFSFISNKIPQKESHCHEQLRNEAIKKLKKIPLYC